jgi:hypothetical protein
MTTQTIARALFRMKGKKSTVTYNEIEAVLHDLVSLTSTMNFAKRKHPDYSSPLAVLVIQSIKHTALIVRRWERAVRKGR